MHFLLFLCTTFTLSASSLSSQQLNDRPKELSEAEIAIIGLQPPNDSKQRTTQSNKVLSNLKAQESLTSSFITYDEEPQSKPFTITFPITRSSGNKQSVQSIVIPLPSNLDDKTGIIVIEDHDDGENLDRRTLRAQFFSPNRIRSFKSQPLKVVNERNETEVPVNRMTTPSKLSQTSRTQALKKETTETKAEPSTISSVVFDDDIAPATSTFSPESVFRPKVLPLLQNNKKQNITTHFKLSPPTADTVTLNLQTRQRINRRFTTPVTTITAMTTTTTESPTTEFTEENTESTTFTIPETTTRRKPTLRKSNSVNGRANIRRNLIQNSITTTTEATETTETTTQRITTQRPTTIIPTTLRPTTLRPTTLRPTTLRPTTLRPTTLRPTTLKPTTLRPTTLRPTTQRITTQRPTTTTTIPTTFTTSKMTTTTTPMSEVTEPDYELISLDNSTRTDFDSNSLKLIKSKNRTSVSDNETITGPRPPGAPQIPGNFGFLPSGKAFNLPQNVPGNPGVDYPTYDKIPLTSFDCRDQIYPGFYSDMEAGCQVYHSCNGKLRASKHTFLCPNGTIFSQEYLICDWWYNVKCEDSPIYYPLNKEAFSSDIKSNSTKPKTNKKRNKPKTTTTEFVIRTITTTDLP